MLGRNCRFLQGPGTDPKHIDMIRNAVAKGNDFSICVLNYKADGTPFWNQLFVAALRDNENCIVNFVSMSIRDFVYETFVSFAFFYWKDRCTMRRRYRKRVNSARGQS